LLVEVEGGQGEGNDFQMREMGKDTELGGECGVRKEENGETAQGQVVEEFEVFIEALGLCRINVIITRDEHEMR